MDNRTFGYARVSSREQHEDRQIEALTNYGVSRDNIIVDKCSGKDTEREGYQYLKKQILRSGDTLVIKELDRLSRSKSDIFLQGGIDALTLSASDFQSFIFRNAPKHLNQNRIDHIHDPHLFWWKIG